MNAAGVHAGSPSAGDSCTSSTRSHDTSDRGITRAADVERNVITVVARESEDTLSRYTMIVRRDGPNGEALPTPKMELFGEDWQFSGDDR